MNTFNTLLAVQSLLLTCFDRVYIYPDEYASVPQKPETPFLVLEADPGSLNTKAKHGGLCAFDSWQVKIELYGAEDIGEYPSTKDATNRIEMLGYRDTIMSILDKNKTLNNTVQHSGDDANMYTHAVAPLQWNQNKRYTGYVFMIPVQT